MQNTVFLTVIIFRKLSLSTRFFLIARGKIERISINSERTYATKHTFEFAIAFFVMVHDIEEVHRTI